MHRWNADIEARVRALYLHKVQEKYENEVKAINTMIEHITDNRFIAKEEKRKDKLLKQIAEVKEYDEILDHIANEHIDIDLTLPLVSKQTDISEKSQAKSQASKSNIMEQRKKLVLEQIKLGENVTTPLLVKELGVSERQIRTVLDQLKNEGKIHFEREGKSGRWIAD